MSIFDAKTGPLAEQVQLTLRKLRTVSDDGTFSLNDFPDLSESYVEFVKDLLRKKYGDDKGARETAQSTLLRALQSNEMCSENRVFDRGLYAVYALHPAALEWPCGDVQQLIRYLGFYNGYVRQRAAQELAQMGEAARPALPALQRCAAGDPRNVGTAAALTALRKLSE
jgi:hypothetical protein